MTEMLKGKRLLVMGGMRISCEIVRKAAELGIYTIVADYNPVEKSPAKAIADEAVNVSITDVDAVVDVIRERKVDGVIVGFNDMLLPYYANICSKAGLPCYGTKEQFEILTDKQRYKALCRKFGIPVIPEYKKVEEADYPVLVKPIDSSGSRGITICHDREELDRAVATGKGASKKGETLIEKYMDGQEVTVFWTFQDGAYFLSAMGNRHVRQNQGSDVIPLPVGYTFPSIYLPRYRKEVEGKCKAMFKELGIRDGMMFMQCKVEDGQCFVYDLGYRLTGSLEYKVLDRICGYNPLEMLIHFALTGRMADESIAAKAIPEFPRPAYNVSCLSAPGTIASIQGLDAVKAIPGVIDAVIAHPPGDTIQETMRGLLAQITVRVLGTLPSAEDAFPIMKKVGETIRIIGEDGKVLNLPGIEEEDILNRIL